MNDTRQLSAQQLRVICGDQRQEFQGKNRGITRKVLEEISPAIASGFVCVITGLRRSGKSTLLRQIADRYFSDDFYYISFEDERFINFNVQDFQRLHETLIELFGEKKTFFIDEIQNIEGWERFVRRLHDSGYKLIVTGSNASLLSKELGTRLTGRTVAVPLYPFSFSEFLCWKGKTELITAPPTTSCNGLLRNHLRDYLIRGGIPDALAHPELDIHRIVFDDVLYRDILERYQVTNVKALKELAFNLVSNPASLVTLTRLKNIVKLGSLNTVKDYLEYLTNSWLFFFADQFSHSVSSQQNSPKKTYCIDPGLATVVGFHSTNNVGHLMENVAFLHLKRSQQSYFDDIYYYQTKSGFEVDFYQPRQQAFIQVVPNFDDPDTQHREIRALVEAVKENPGSSLTLVTESHHDTLHAEGHTITVVPFYEWLLKDRAAPTTGSE